MVGFEPHKKGSYLRKRGGPMSTNSFAIFGKEERGQKERRRKRDI